jgi:chorismate mutase
MKTYRPHFFKAHERPLVIAGPCSAESREQLLDTARQLAKDGRVNAIRAGVWKPRTRPGSFEGIGTPALQWLIEAREETGLPVATEVANRHHVEAALKAGVDILWIGARTTVNPFYVQEIADALRGTDIPVLVKNPIHPDIGLWVGALERLQEAGIRQLAAVLRGFFAYDSGPFRNEPRWEMTFELRGLAPDLPILCDPSHIAGRRDLIATVAQTAMDIQLEGLMIETHCRPEEALSDAKQQITPVALSQILDQLVLRKQDAEGLITFQKLEGLRAEIDQIDVRLIQILTERFKVVEAIGLLKNQEQISIFQLERFFQLLDDRRMRGIIAGLDPDLLRELFQVIHKFSVQQQVNTRVNRSS